MAFWSRYGRNEFLLMSICLNNAEADFMDLINRKSRHYLESYLIVFIDDITVYSNSDYEHMGHLRILF